MRTLLRGVVTELRHWRIVLESKQQVPEALLPANVCMVKKLWGLDVAAVQDKGGPCYLNRDNC